MSLKELESNLNKIPEPTYYFEIGDKVKIGNCINPVITGIYLDGKAYEVSFISIEKNKQPTTVKRVLSWLDIRKPTETEDSLIKNENIFIHFSQRNLTDILHKRYHFGLNMHPFYQREYVWDEEDKVNLIDSIFNNIDIGKFVFRQLPIIENKDMYEIVDGKQRVNTICEFYEDRFTYKNKKFSDLSKKDQHHFTYYPISYGSVERVTDKEVVQIFLMLNSTGRVMDKHHLNQIKNIYKDM